jgi:hypothetical protein
MGGLTTSPSAASLSPASPTSATPQCGAHNFGCTPRRALDSTRATHGPDVYDYGRTTYGFEALPAPLFVLPSGYTRATSTASLSAVTTGEGRTGGTSGQSSFDDHAGEVGFPAFD